MQAVILAAGMGTRLGDLTKDRTKCMVEINGETLIYRLLCQLEKLNLDKIIIVVGYCAKKLKEYISNLNIRTDIVYVMNDVYDKTNNIYSLFLAKEHLHDDTLLFESDLIFDSTILESLVSDKRKNLAVVAKYQSWMDGTCVKLSKDDYIDSFITKDSFNFLDVDSYYKTVNIYKFDKKFLENIYIPLLEMYINLAGMNVYYEQVLKFTTIDSKTKIQGLKIRDENWYEIDDIQDLDIASSIFSKDSFKYDALLKRYGGYWRYPKLLDFCYLVNPHFPSKKMKNELATNFDILLCNYPSGQEVISLLASKIYKLNIQNIVVGNGASELIKYILLKLNGSYGIITPSFDEYKNRLNNINEIIYYDSSVNDFHYTANDIINYFNNRNIENLIIINPDNPTGNYIKKQDMVSLLEWSLQKNIKIILDESFVDFSDEVDSSFLNNEFINKYKNLIVIKSISKSHGVPGLRLGIMASSDRKLIQYIKSQISIWNINSFAEYYLQIFEKYNKEYKDSLKKFQNDRINFINKLSKIKNIKIYNTQANYIMLECLNGMSSYEIASKLLTSYNILVKDLSRKIYSGKCLLRIAIRDNEDNMKFVESLNHVLYDVN